MIVDRDDDDCEALKRKMESFAIEAELATRIRRKNGQYFVVNRIAVEEREAWYFGDWEAFERLLKKVGYYKTGLRKVEAAH